MTETSESWTEQGKNMGLNDDIVRIELYCDHRDKTAWEQEAQEHRSSRSKYLRDMIDLGRTYRKEGNQDRQEAGDRIRELERSGRRPR